MKAMAGLIDEVTRLNNKCNQLEAETEQIKQEIRNMLNDMWDLSDHTMYSIALVREMLESLLGEGGEKGCLLSRELRNSAKNTIPQFLNSKKKLG